MSLFSHVLRSLPLLAALSPSAQTCSVESPAIPAQDNGAQFSIPIRPEHLPVNPGPAGVTVGLDWDGDLRLDVAQLLGDQVFVASAVDLHRTFVPMHLDPKTGYLGLGQLPGAPDRLMTTHEGQGLELWSWDGASGEFTPTALQSSWTDVNRLCTADLNGDGHSDIVGRRSAGLVSLIANGSGGFLPGPSFHSSVPIVDLDPLDWDGDGTAEISILTGAEIQIWRPVAGGLLFQSASPVGSGLQAAPIRKTTGGAQSLAVLSELAGVSQFLTVIDAVAVEPPQAIGNLDICALTGGDSDGDGDDDLLLISAAAPLIYGLENQNSTGLPVKIPTYSISPADVLAISYGDVGQDLSGQGVGMVHRDLDHDGDADLALFRAYDSTLVVQRNGLINENDHRVHLPTFGVDVPASVNGTVLILPTEVWPFYEQNLGHPNPGADQWSQSPYELEVTLWKIEPGETPDPIPTLDPIPAFLGSKKVNSAIVNLLVTIPVQIGEFDHTYATVIRRVRYDPPGTLIEAGPDSYFEIGFFNDAGEENATAGSNPGPGPPPVATECSRPPCNTAGC